MNAPATVSPSRRPAALLMAVALIATACAASPEAGVAVTDLPPAQPFFWESGGDSNAPSLVDLDEIIAGGPPPDGIPPIDAPTYESIEAADAWLADTEPVLVLELGDRARAYPIQIMTFHEIVNDVLGGQPVLVTYCPLCNSGLAFDPTVAGETLDFGTSGRLYQSNLMMYDRQTRSLWSQFTGQAVVGPLLEAELERLPLGLVAWQDFAAAHPDGDVLSRDTGHSRDYGTNPYVGYDSSDSPFLFAGPTNDALPQMARIVATGGDQDPVAVPVEALRAAGVINTAVDDAPTVVWWAAGVTSALDTRDIAAGSDVGASGVFSRVVGGQHLTFAADGPDEFTDAETGTTWNVLGDAVAGPLAGSRLVRLESDDTFWFVQFAFRPRTRIITD